MIRLGVVGYGERIHGVIEQALRAVAPDVRVAGIVDPDEAGARARLAECDRKDVVFRRSLDELVRTVKPDGLMIGTRCHLHTPYAVAAAKYDLPLFLEKPVATSLPQAMALEKAFRKTRCRVVVSFPLRVTPLCELAREHIAKGTIGEPLHVMGVNYVPYGTIYFDHAYRDYRINQGMFLQKATHDFDYISYLMDSPIVRVGAMTVRGRVFGGRKKAGLRCSQCGEHETCLESPRNRRRNGSGGTVNDHWCVYSRDCGSPATGMNEDCSSAVIEFASGAQGVYSQVFFSRREAGWRGATVTGYHGTLSFDWYRSELKCVRHHRPYTSTGKVSDVGGHSGGDFELARDFAGLIDGSRRVSRTPIETGLRSVFACLAAKRSAETGRFHKVRQLGW